MRHFKALWGICPIDKNWKPLDRAPESDLMNTEKWKIEYVGLMKAKGVKFIKAEGALEEFDDEYLCANVMGGTTMPIDQLIFRVTDLNYIAPPATGKTSKAKMPPKPTTPFVQTFEHPQLPIVNT